LCEIAGSGGRHRPPHPVSQRPVDWFRRRCRWAAARLRTATGVTGFDPGRDADQRTPWLGLLLWALASAGLFVSLLMQADELDHEPRLAAHEAIAPEQPRSAFSLPAQVGKGRLWASEYSPPR
jgi:hypothetical protein